MISHSRLLPTLAFIAGVALTLGFKDFYPDLERRFRQRRKEAATANREPHVGDKLRVTADEVEADLVSKQVLCSSDKSAVEEGLETCIGNTPLFRIKSLSEATGCEILAKAEV